MQATIGLYRLQSRSHHSPTIKKRVPIRLILRGGNADAAAMLVGLPNRIL